MIICLVGEDSYRRSGKVRELTRAYKTKNPSMDMAVYDLDDSPDDWQKVRDFLEQPSMFAETKLAVVKEAQSVEDKDWIKVLKTQIDSKKTFVIVSDKKSPKKAFKFFTKDPVRFQEFGELEGAVLSAFIKKEAGLRGLEFSDEARRFFLAYISDSKERSALTINELEKIYLLGIKGKISKPHLDKVIRFEKKEAVWRAGFAILKERNIFRRLGILEKVFLQREAPSYVFNSLGFQSRGKEALILADYDVSIKSGCLEYEEALTGFALSVS